MIRPLLKPRRQTKLEKRQAKLAAGRKNGGTTVRAKNDVRAAKKYLRNFHGPMEADHSVYVRSLPCCACGRVGLTEAAHTKARGMGGANGDWSAIAPLCGFDGKRTGCHELYDLHRSEFCEAFPHCNPFAVAAELAAEYLRRAA